MMAPGWVEPYLGNSMIGLEEIEAVRSVLQSGALFRYSKKSLDMCRKSETRISEIIDAPHVRLVANCTIALEAAIAAIGGCPCEVVLIPGISFVATATSVLRSGYIPFLVDVDLSGHMDPFALVRAIRMLKERNVKVAGVICVHLDGSGACIMEIARVCRREGLFLIEDCAQSFGVTRDGKALGVFGDIGCFSFQENKILTSGEGGAIVASRKDIFLRAVAATDFGALRGNDGNPVWAKPLGFGTNGKCTEITGALVGRQLDRLNVIRATLDKHSRKIERLLGASKIQERHPEDIRLSVWIEDQQLVARLVCANVPVYSWEHMLLADHPVLAQRRSSYANGFPWSSVADLPHWETPVAAKVARDRSCVAVPIDSEACNLVLTRLRLVLERNGSDLYLLGSCCPQRPFSEVPETIRPLVEGITTGFTASFEKPALVLGGSCICFAKGNPMRLSLQDLIDNLMPIFMASFHCADVALYFQSHEALMSSGFMHFDASTADHCRMKDYLDCGVRAVMKALGLPMPHLSWIETSDESIRLLVDRFSCKLRSLIPRSSLYGLYEDIPGGCYPRGTPEEEDVIAVYQRNLSLYRPEFIHSYQELVPSSKGPWLIFESSRQSRAIRTAGVADRRDTGWHLAYQPTPSRQQGKEMAFANRNHKVELRSTERQIIERSRLLEGPHSPYGAFYQNVFGGLSICEIMRIWRDSLQ